MKKRLAEESVIFVSVLKWFVLATFVGGMVGISTTVFLKALAWSIAYIDRFPYSFLLLPAALFLSGCLIKYLAPDAEGQGTDKVIEAVHKQSGKIKLMVVPVKLVATIITIATREGIHIEVDTLFNKLSHKNRIVTSLISEILTVIFFITLTIIGIKLTMAHWLFTTPTYEFPMSVLSFPLPASASLMAVYTVNKIFRLWGRYKELSR